MALQHLRSSTADKRPTPAAMSDGQLAMNTNLASPGLFLKDSNGDLVKVGPVHVGTTAPNATPASGGQAGNSVGEQWLDTTGGNYKFKIWDGTAWRTEDGEFVNASGDTMTGALGIIAGTNTAPGVFFSGDTNTGIYSPGADQVAVATNGAGRLFIDASGNVGVGTASPIAPLHVVGNIRAQQFIPLTDSATAPGLCVAVETDTGFFRPAADTIGVSTGATERLRITSAGLVGIGTTSPVSSLHVAGITTAYGNGSPSLRWGDTSTLGTLTFSGSDPVIQTNTGNLLFLQGTTERARIDSSGRLLVGTSSNSGGAQLQVNNNHIRVGNLNIKTAKATSIISAAGNQSQLITALGTNNELIAVQGAFTGQVVNSTNTMPTTGTKVLTDYGDIQLFLSAADGGSIFIKRDAGSGAIDVVLTVYY